MAPLMNPKKHLYDQKIMFNWTFVDNSFKLVQSSAAVVWRLDNKFVLLLTEDIDSLVEYKDKLNLLGEKYGGPDHVFSLSCVRTSIESFISWLKRTNGNTRKYSGLQLIFSATYIWLESRSPRFFRAKFHCLTIV